ncbi:MAG: tRNA threonylcarbamoyladenosine dehydratase [Clostridia bacterium]|nr:tRNA threonylcarbamoyladenosine dehydratase [Clostridia bacterium]
MFDRTSILLGEQAVEKLKNANVCICGLGGVGSYVLEAIARIGVGKITVIDKDVVDASNINRQLVASWYTVGMEKTEVAKVHIETVNPKAQVNAITDYIDTVNIEKYITEEFDYVIDAIDSIASKIAIIKRCKELNIPVISCMGMGNKVEPLRIKVADISKTQVCPLARIIRKRLKELNISDVLVVYSEEEPIKNNQNILGSVPYVPSVAGLVIASEVVKKIIE